MRRSAAVDGFELAYDRVGTGPAVVLLHGWPGDRTDYRALVPLLPSTEVVVPDLRGFGGSDKPAAAPVEQYAAAAQARSIAGLLDELGLARPVVVGYDVGSRVAQALATARPDLVGALVLAPPLPGAGRRVLDPQATPEFWYQPFHRLPLAEQLVDGKPDAVRDYLAHFWSHWSGPDFTLAPADLEHLVSVYSPPGAFTASINWYRAGAGTAAVALTEVAPELGARIGTPTAVLWPEHDPLFPRAWSDRLDEFFSDVILRPADGVGHFSPLEAPQLFAEQVKAALDRRRRPFVGGSARRGSAGNRPRPPPSAGGAALANTKQQPPPRFICGRGLIRSASATIVSRVVTRTNERRRDGDRSEVPEVIAWRAAEHRDH